MYIKEIFKKIILGNKYSSETYIKYLRSIGMKIGNECTIYVPSKTLIDEQYPWLITIGNHVRITQGVIVLTHDYSWSVLKGLSDKESEKIQEGIIPGASGSVTIGNNVFIGMNSVITRNVSIGNNVIIGAGSVVTKDCQDNGVYAGAPARRIMEIDEYYEKRKQAQLIEAKNLAIKYYERFGKMPARDIFHEYFMLFENDVSYRDEKIFVEKMNLCGNLKKSEDYLRNHKPIFENYDEFMKYCFEGETKE